MCDSHHNNSPSNNQAANGNTVNRRQFMRAGAALGAGVVLAQPAQLFAASGSATTQNIKSKGYAAFDDSGTLKPWEFERRPVGDNDILIDIKFASICHSDIHQMKGHWGAQQYPQVPGHEMVDIVSAVGKNVTKFKVGDRAGVGCMVDSCLSCDECKDDEEQYCPHTVFTYGYPQKSSPTGISQGGYSTNIVVRDHFAVHIPDSISFETAAPLLCAGITTYSPLMKMDLKPGVKVGVAGIGGLGHLAIKFAVSKGAEVTAFTTSADKVKDIIIFGAKHAVVVKDASSLAAHKGTLDYMISTIPYKYDVASYVSVVKPYGYYTQVGMPENFSLAMNNLALSASRVNYNASLIGGIKETQEVVNYCAEQQLLPEIQIISADQINRAWNDVVNKKARYRYVIDAASI